MLTTHQLRAFGERGFVVVPGVFPPDRLEQIRRAFDATLAANPPADSHRGPYFCGATLNEGHPLLNEPAAGPVLAAAQQFVGPYPLTCPEQVQIAVTIRPFDHRPGHPHIDGLTPPEPDGRPGTFTLLAGVLLTDQTTDDRGNLWVWPGTHRTAADYFRRVGPDALINAVPYPPIPLPEPEQVHGRVGDLLLAHYLLAHNIGGNTGPEDRRTIYYRLRTEGHRDRWRSLVQDALAEFLPVHNASQR